VYAGLERVPNSLLEASGDLGDYITVGIVGGGSQMLGTLVYQDIGAANNLPLASAIALIPIIIIFGYLFLVRRTGALDNL